MFNIFNRKHDYSDCFKVLNDRISDIDLNNDELIISLIKKGRQEHADIKFLMEMYEKMQDHLIAAQNTHLMTLDKLSALENRLKFIEEIVLGTQVKKAVNKSKTKRGK